MSASDKARNRAGKLAGLAREKRGQLIGDEDQEQEGKAEKAKADLEDAGRRSKTRSEWIWGAPLMLALFAAGALLPSHVDVLAGITSVSSAPRHFAGSSAATYFLGAPVTAVLLRRTHAACSPSPHPPWA